MPVMTGTEAAPILKRTIPHVKIILFTLHADGRDKAVASTAGVDLTLSKTDRIKKLGEHLKPLLTPGEASVHAEKRRSEPQTASE